MEKLGLADFMAAGYKRYLQVIKWSKALLGTGIIITNILAVVDGVVSIGFVGCKYKVRVEESSTKQIILKTMFLV